MFYLLILAFVVCDPDISDWDLTPLTSPSYYTDDQGQMFWYRYNFNKTLPVNRTTYDCSMDNCVAQELTKSSSTCNCYGNISTQSVTIFDDRQGLNFSYCSNTSLQQKPTYVTYVITCAGHTSFSLNTLGYTITISIDSPSGCPKNSFKKIGLVGDRTYYAYPAFLKALAGSQYTITDYAVGDTTAMASSHIDPQWEAYRDTSEFRDVLTADLDVIVVLLGTNDGHPRNFPASNPSVFQNDYESLIAAFVKAHPTKRVLVCTTPYSYEPDLEGANREKVEEAYIRPMQIATAEKYGLAVVDTASATRDDPGFLSSDGLHPTLEGAERLAGIIYDAITNLSKNARRGV